jgi:MtrB/PioB family decaheme-associated outer membrane protein
VLALALLAAFGPAGAEDGAAAGGIETSASAAIVLGKDAARELDLRWKRPGDWAVRTTVAQTTHEDRNRPSNGADLSLKRTRLGLSLAKIINPRLQLDVSLSSENKDGARLFGIGMTCPSAVAPGCGGTTGTETGWALLMLPEPIKANHSQVEARLSYAGDKFSVSAGYYGSFYRNSYGSLTANVPASLNNPLGEALPLSAGLRDILSQPVALAPDNQAHQVDVSGTYAFTPTTRLNFKLAYSQALQNQDFAGAGLSGAPAGVENLGGRVDTTLAQLGITARPWTKLSLSAKLRYEDRDDRTPIAAYNIEDTTTYTNRRLPLTKLRGQAQASYQITSDYRATLGADYEAIDRGVFTPTSAVAGISALRQKTDETTLRAELRRRMDENISGAISVASSQRKGSNWLRNNSGIGVTEVTDPADPSVGFATAIFMPTLADRQRDSVKLQVDWQPTEKLALQFSAQGGRDKFDTPSAYGLRRSGMDQGGVDATYTLSEAWSLNGNIGYSTETLRQARPAAAALAYANTSRTLGVGVTGKINPKIDVGAHLSFIDDRSSFEQTLDPAADGASAALLAATGGLPDIVFRQTQLKLFGRYELNKQSELRLDLIHQRSSWSDWAWAYNGVPFRYSDGTTIDPQARRSVTFVGLRWVYHWQ